MAEQNAQDMLVTGAVMGAASVVRAGLGCLELWAERAPSLLALGERMREQDSGEPQVEFRDALLAVARDSSQIALRELRRGVEDLDTFTRPREPPATRKKRPHKTKR